MISWLTSSSPFYNSNYSKLNGSASLFEEAQLNNNKLYSAEMARGSRSQRNVPLSTIGPSKPEQPVSPKKTPVTTYTNGLFQQFMKAYLENQNQALPPTLIQAEFREQLLKAQFLDLYYGNSHLDYYSFCQQCEDHFETVGANGPKRIPFAALFLRSTVAQR